MKQRLLSRRDFLKSTAATAAGAAVAGMFGNSGIWRRKWS